MKKHFLTFIILLNLLISFQANITYAQELPYTRNLSWEHERHSWIASWISPVNESLNDYGVFLFRNILNLETRPDSFTIHVSADNRYRLYVNGEYVSAGPARGSFMYWRYETLDISPFLKQGENIISAEVINFGEHRPVAQFSHQTAFILQSEEFGNMLNTGSGNWKVIRDRSYNVRPVTVEMTEGKYYVAGPCDSITSIHHPWGWKHNGFEAEKWAKPQIIQKGVGRGYMHGTPWMLVPREIPLMEERIERIPRVSRSKGLDLDPGFKFGDNPLIIPASTKATILLDQTHLTFGYPVFNISKGKGSKIKVIYSEALYSDDGSKGNRNEIEGKEIQGYSDIIMPDGGQEREIMTTWLRTFRFIQLEIETQDDALKINDFYNIYTTYPFEQNGSFDSDDPRLSQIWDVGWRTARLCAGETYMDCPYWEQLQYIGDTRIQSLISLYVSGDDRLMRNAIKLADHSRIPEGLTLSRGPSYINQIIPAFSLYWIAMVHDYYMHRTDDDFIESCLPGIQAILGWFERRMDENGMLGGLEWFNFSDWTDGFLVGAPAGVDEGNSALISLNYVYALERAAELYAYFGYEMEAGKYSSMAKNIKSKVYDLCWVASSGLMADTPEQKEFSQHTNIFSILTGCISDEEQQEVMMQVLNNPDLIQTTIYYKFYLFETLHKTGMADKYLGMMQPWETMLEDGLTTFAEGDYNDRSDCHAWSASPLYHFLSSVAGIRPETPGFNTVRIEPKLGHLNNLNVKVAHPQGIISLNLIKTGKRITGDIELPAGLEGTFFWDDEEIELSEGNNNIKL
jgi:hypothetical protein